MLHGQCHFSPHLVRYGSITTFHFAYDLAYIGPYQLQELLMFCTGQDDAIFEVIVPAHQWIMKALLI